VNLKKNLLGITRADWLTKSWWEFFFQGAPKKMLTEKKQVIGGPSIALEAPKLEGPRGKNPTS
jgi:hypothetical protein